MDDVDKLAAAIVQKMKDEKHIFWIDPETHSDEHDFIKMMIQERADKLARRKAIEDKIAGSLIISGVLVVIGVIGAGVLSWLREHLK